MSIDGSSAPQNNHLLWVLAELTYRCPLHCVYCSNPVELSQYAKELPSEIWIRAFEQARELGAAQLGFSGGRYYAVISKFSSARQAALAITQI